jgi:hypothetical protein
MQSFAAIDGVFKIGAKHANIGIDAALDLPLYEVIQVPRGTDSATNERQCIRVGKYR